MAKKTNYYFITPAADNSNFIDFGLNYGSITTAGDEITFVGSGRVDSMFVRPGITYDMSNTGVGADKIYFSGSLADYTTEVVAGNLKLSRTVGGQSEIVTVAPGTILAHDNLIFANGTVSANDLFNAVNLTTPKPVPNPSETSGAPAGAAAAGAALNATVKAFATGTASFGQAGQTFATTKPGINFVVTGGAGIDTVYVADGENVTATALGGSVDLIYMRGNWADYTKTVGDNDTTLVLTRQVGGNTESVKVQVGTVNQYDKLIFADGAVTTFNAKTALQDKTLPSPLPLTSVPGNDPTTTTPLYDDAQIAAALDKIKTAAENESATDTTPTLATYTIAGVKGVTADNLASINSALNSKLVDGSKADTTPEVQAIVDAYKAIIAAANGTAGSTPLNGDTYAAVGVTGVAGATPTAGSALALMDSVVDVASKANVDTVGELQSIADAAVRVMSAAGGTTAQAQALTLDDLKALGITGATPANLWAVQSAIQAASTDAAVDTQAELQALVTAAANGVSDALGKIQYAADHNTATLGDPAATPPRTPLTVAIFNAAGITGVTADNLASVNSALDSAVVNGVQATTAAQVQTIVNDYNAILASADGVHPLTPATPLSANVYKAIGVTGLDTGNGSILTLVNDVVDLSVQTAVNTEPKVQAIVDAASHVMQDVNGGGFTPHVTLQDLTTLGIVGVTNNSDLGKVVNAITGLTDPTLVGTQYLLQQLVNDTLGNSNLHTIAAAAQNNSATNPAALIVAQYTAAGVTGVDNTNIAAINSALDSVAIDGARADTAPKLQAIVDAYKAILSGANGTAGSTAITAAQFAAVGVTGITGATTDTGTALHLLDDVVDLSNTAAVDTTTELQALADAAARVMELTGNPNATISPSVQDLNLLLGNNSVTAANLAAIQNALKLATDAGVDTRAELQALVDNVNNSIVPTTLSNIQYAALHNSAASGDATTTPPHAPLTAATYAAAGVTGVDASNLAAINSALDSAAVTDTQVTTVAQIQAIVDNYKAILANADGWSDNDPSLSGNVFASVGVTGLPTGAPTAGSALNLLSSTVDQSKAASVDSVPELQAMADAAKHVIADVGATGASGTTLADLTALNISGVNAGNLAAVQAAIKALASPSLVDTQGELQRLVDGVLGTVGTALLKISAAAENNNANGAAGVSALTPADYVAAGVAGVTAGNVFSINSALNSTAINGDMTDTTAEVQAVVDGYTAILASADQTLNAVNPLSAAQYASIGVTGVSGPYAAGNALHLLDDVVDQAAVAAVDTQPEVQALADAAKAVISAAETGAPTAVTKAGLEALGITGVTDINLTAIREAIAATNDDGTGVDTLAELQAVVNSGQAAATKALDTIQKAATANNASNDITPASVFTTAGVIGVTASNLASIQSALNSGPVSGTQADTTAEIQAIVNDYTAILNSADGNAGNTGTPLTAAQYTDVGVSGVTGTYAPGTALFLLDNVVDGKASTAVDTVDALQALANAANHVMGTVGSTTGSPLTLGDLASLGVTGVNSLNLSTVQAAVAHAAAVDVDTLPELQALINTAVTHPTLSTNLSTNVTNLDVTSNLVLNVDQTVKVGTGKIHIFDLGGAGYHGDVSTNSQEFDVATAESKGLLTISGSGTGTKIIINPLWDLDLSSNYKLTIDDGAFVSAAGKSAATFGAVNFSTVTPGTHTTGHQAYGEAASSLIFLDDGSLVQSKYWMDIEGIGNNTGIMEQLGSLSNRDFALVMKNYATTPGGDPTKGGDGSDGMLAHDTNVGVTDFGNGDVLYFDSQVNNSSIQKFNADYTILVDGAPLAGGFAGQNTLTEGLVASPQQNGSQANIALGLEGNTNNTIYAAINDLTGTTGLTHDWHKLSAPVIMG